MDPSQLPEALEGPFRYHHSEWVKLFQVSILISLQSLTSPLPFTAPPLGSLNPVQNQSFNNTIKIQSSPQ